MDCFRCHTPIPDDSRYCLACGADVSNPGVGAATTAAMTAAASEQLLRLVRQEVGNEFEVEHELGRGGMAIVYLATEVHLGRKVAIKVLPPDLTFSGDTIDRFKREARTAATLDHPNIIPIHRVSTGGRLFWYAMKFLEGRSLADILKERQRLPLDATVRILEQVASALDYAHARHVVHRDIKPANIMLDAADRVIVTDFGIAKQLSAGSLTSSGSAIGTPYYMSPEQCHGAKTLTGAADQYSTGVMTYQMLSGQVPFEGDSAIDILTKHCTQKPPPLDILRPGLPRHVYQAIDRALAKVPGERFPNVATFVEGLTKPGRVSATLVSPKQRASWDQSTTEAEGPRSGRRWVRVLAAAAVAGVLLGASWLVFANGSLSPSRDASLADSASVAVSPRVDSTRGPGAPPGVRDQGVQLTAKPTPVLGQRATSAPSKDTTTPPSGATRRAPAQSAAPAPVTREPARPGVLVVRTSGGWARIYVDNVLRREGTSHRDTLPAGTHALRFEREGYVTIDTTVTIRANEVQLLTVTMRVRDQ